MVRLNGGDTSSYRSRGPRTMQAPCGAPYARRRAAGSPNEGVRARRRTRGATRASPGNTPVPDGSRAGGTRGRHPNVDTRDLDRRRLDVLRRLVLAAATVLAAAPASAQEEAGPLVAQPRGSHRRVSGVVNASHGGFYTGRRTQIGYNGRLEFGPRFSLEPRILLDWVTLQDESFRVTLLGARPTRTPGLRAGPACSTTRSRSSSHACSASEGGLPPCHAAT